MDVLAWGVCNDSSILWGILKTTTQDAVEVWTLWYVNYITRERLYEKNPLQEVILDSQVVPFFSLNFGNYVTLIKIMMMVKEKKRYFADLCCHLPPRWHSVHNSHFWAQKPRVSHLCVLNLIPLLSEPGSLTESLLRALVTPVFLLCCWWYRVPTPR